MNNTEHLASEALNGLYNAVVTVEQDEELSKNYITWIEPEEEERI